MMLLLLVIVRFIRDAVFGTIIQRRAFWENGILGFSHGCYEIYGMNIVLASP